MSKFSNLAVMVPLVVCTSCMDAWYGTSFISIEANEADFVDNGWVIDEQGGLCPECQDEQGFAASKDFAAKIKRAIAEGDEEITKIVEDARK